MTPLVPLPHPVRRVAVVGLGYVGLPVAVAFGRRFPTVGFDLDPLRVDQLRTFHDATGEVSSDRLREAGLRLTNRGEELAGSDFFIVTVPTPIDRDRRPDLSALERASTSIGSVLRAGAIVVYESTVYPGVTEDFCGPILERTSGLKCGVDFKLGYSPERINPGDREHTFERITKVVSGQDADALETIAACYGAVVEAGVHRAPSIKVAESAKVIENTQRDLNIALMNELSIIFEKLGIDTHDVLEAARTKWNFLPFSPGLVGGHCIGVDPYYLTTRAEQVGIHPQVILAGRKINDSMGAYVAQATVKNMIACGSAVNGAHVAVLGVTFKENVPDTRNSRVPDILSELREYGIRVSAYDPRADAQQVEEEYGIRLVSRTEMEGADALILAVPHQGLREMTLELLENRDTKVLIDVKGVVERSAVPSHVKVWRL